MTLTHFSFALGLNDQKALLNEVYQSSDHWFKDFLTSTQQLLLQKYQGLDPNLDLPVGEFKIIKDLLNWVEDRRIDMFIYKSAPGYREYYTSMYDHYFNDKVVTKGIKSDECTEETFESYMFRIINLMKESSDLSKLKYRLYKSEKLILPKLSCEISTLLL